MRTARARSFAREPVELGENFVAEMKHGADEHAQASS
jgi:hypothetical protein